MSEEAYKYLTEIINQGEYVDWAKYAHESWLELKTSQGWRYGPERDAENKKNPLLVPFEELPESIRGANSVTPYAVVNFFRKNAEDKTLAELRQIFQDILDGNSPELLEELGEYVHSHFIISLLSKGETTTTRKDMVVYEDLDDETKTWDTYTSQEYIKRLIADIDEG